MTDKHPTLFSRATLKLTLIYTAIIFAMSVVFSVVVGTVVIRGSDRPFDRPPAQIVFSDGSQMDFKPAFANHNQEVASDVIAELVGVNVLVLFVGAAASFALARFSLRPIERAMNEQTDFVANASHELKTPLAVMQTENEVALREKNPTKTELRENLADNLAEVKKLRKLTEYLLAMNAAENSVVELRETDLDEIVRGATERISRKAEQKNITILRKITPAKIRTNAENLTEIVYILLDNAVKYSPENSRILVVASAHEISVQDEGGGILDEDLLRIFERFYRSEKSHTSEGFGLGLALAKNLAEKIHVEIFAKNVQKKGENIGAKFVIKL